VEMQVVQEQETLETYILNLGNDQSLQQRKILKQFCQALSNLELRLM
jgi:hypothetical protein